VLFTKHLLPQQGIPQEGVVAGTISQERVALHWIYCNRSHGAITAHENERQCIALPHFSSWDKVNDIFGLVSATKPRH